MNPQSEKTQPSITVTITPPDQKEIKGVWLSDRIATGVRLRIETNSKYPPLEGARSSHPENSRALIFKGGVEVLIEGLPWKNIEGPMLLEGRGYLDVLYYDGDNIGTWQSI